MFIEILGKGSRRSKRIDLKLRASADRKPGMAGSRGTSKLQEYRSILIKGVRLERAGVRGKDEAIDESA